MFDNKVAYTGDLAKDWGPKLWLGIFLVVFGAIVFFVPNLTLTGMIALFGGFCLLTGIILVANAVMGSMLYMNNLIFLFEGVLVFVIGVLVLAWPLFGEDMTDVELLYFFGLYALLVGLFRVIEAVWMPSEVKNVVGRPAIWVLLLAGIFSVVIGIVVMAFSWDGILDILWIVGLYASLFGVMVLTAAMMGSK